MGKILKALKKKYPNAEGNSIKAFLRSALGSDGRTYADIIEDTIDDEYDDDLEGS